LPYALYTLGFDNQEETMRQIIALMNVTILALLLSVQNGVASDGVINAVSYRPISDGATITVQVLDNSEQNITLAKEFENALVERGYILSPNGTLILTIETRDEIGGWTSTERSHIVELTSQQNSSHGDSTDLKFNLFNSNTGGILNKGTNSGTIIVTPSQFEINVTLENANDGKRLWEGWAKADIEQSSLQSLRRSMVPVIIDALGNMVTNQTFKVQ